MFTEHDDAAIALTWFSLATYGRDPEDWLLCMYLYCRAAAEGQLDEARRIRAHVLELETPASLKEALRARS